MVSRASVRFGASVASLAGWLAMLGGLMPTGAQERAAAAPAGSTQTVYLEYRELDTRIIGSRLSITPQAESFKKEPDWGGRTICRGTINSAFRGVETLGASPGHTINLPFAWDYKQGKLYLDVNRNGDLMDDSVYSTKPDPGNYHYQTFTNIRLPFKTPAGSHQALVDLESSWSQYVGAVDQFKVPPVADNCNFLF